MSEAQLSARFPLGSVVTELGADVYKVVGYWRGYVTLQHLVTNTTHKAHPNALRAKQVAQSISAPYREERTMTTEAPVREALLSRDETYSDGAYRCRVFDPAKPWASVRVLVEKDGRISWAEPRDWSTLVDWSIAGKLARRCYGPATYGHVDLYLI